MPDLPASLKDSLDFYRFIEKEDGPAGMAMLGKIDLFYLLTSTLRRPDAMHPWLFDRCREVQLEPDNHLDLWAREHYKSTIITFAKSIQDIINNPEITIGIFSHTRPIAKSFLVQIKRELEDNQALKTLYPSIFYADPAKESPRWSDDLGIIVRRQGNPKESTVEAWGLVDGQPTSKHFSTLVYDDVVTRESVTTPEQVAKTTAAWELSDNLGTQEGARRIIGTRYSLHDTYAVMLERKVAIPRIRAATHNGRFSGQPVFFPQKIWEEKMRRQSRKTLAAQHLQNPMADEAATFRGEWLRGYEVRPRFLNVYIMCDPSRGRFKESDNTAISVVGVAPGGTKYLLDGYCHRMTLSQRWVALRSMYEKWSAAPGVQHVEVGYERYGAQSDDEYFQEQMAIEAKRAKAQDKRHQWFAIQELNWPRDGAESKRDRIERLEPDFRNGRFYLPVPVLRDGKPAVWRVNLDLEPDPANPNRILPGPNYGQVEYRDVRGASSAQIEAIDGGSRELLARAIKQIDPDRHVYDLTLWFIDEYVNFPFGRWRDLLDATSRIYDLDPRAPQRVSHEASTPPTFWDS
jgi:hypothetical protein